MQELTKKLMSGAKWISSLAIHPGGDNVLTGTYDKKVQWYDLDLSTMPYQVLTNQNTAFWSINQSEHSILIYQPITTKHSELLTNQNSAYRTINQSEHSIY